MPETTSEYDTHESARFDRSKANIGATENPSKNPAKNKPIPGARAVGGKTSLSALSAIAIQLTSPVEA